MGLEERDGESRTKEYEQFKKEKGFPFNLKGGESRMNRRKSVTKIVWNYNDTATKIIHNLLETKRSFMNEEINLGKS